MVFRPGCLPLALFVSRHRSLPAARALSRCRHSHVPRYRANEIGSACGTKPHVTWTARGACRWQSAGRSRRENSSRRPNGRVASGPFGKAGRRNKTGNRRELDRTLGVPPYGPRRTTGRCLLRTMNPSGLPRVLGGHTDEILQETGLPTADPHPAGRTGRLAGSRPSAKQSGPKPHRVQNHSPQIGRSAPESTTKESI